MLDKTKRGWWRSAVFYQIYPKSFQDSDGDGIGDLPGIISRLDYLEKLGIDGIWLSPVYDSPQVDNGYDISDYRAIWPPFGTMADMENLIAEAKKRGISIIMDLVLNHTSDRHFWFREARKGKDNPYHDYYIWRPGTPDAPPNDLCAVFGGSMWTYVPELGEYYFHQFAPEQPDLNWDNPKVRRELYDMIRFWVEKGVEGFRLDVIDSIAKEPDRHITSRGPRLHQYIRELSREAFREEGLVTVGEAWSADVEEAKRYSAPEGRELSMIFQFEHTFADCAHGDKWEVVPLSLPTLKRCLERWQRGLHGQGWNSLFWDNHDLPRIVSRWGDEGESRVVSAKMLATALHGLQGTPYIFQGEELGMTNIRLPIEEYEDLETRNRYQEQIAKGVPEAEVLSSIYARSRDNARTPMQWTGGENAGFTTGKPWFVLNPNYQKINAQAALADPDSVFYYYQALIALRKRYEVFREGDFTLLAPDDERLFAYTRETETEALLVVCNFSRGETAFSRPEGFGEAVPLLSNYPDARETLRPYEARIYYRRREP